MDHNLPRTAGPPCKLGPSSYFWGRVTQAVPRFAHLGAKRRNYHQDVASHNPKHGQHRHQLEKRVWPLKPVGTSLDRSYNVAAFDFIKVEALLPPFYTRRPVHVEFAKYSSLVSSGRHLPLTAYSQPFPLPSTPLCLGQKSSFRVS